MSRSWVAATLPITRALLRGVEVLRAEAWTTMEPAPVLELDFDPGVPEMRRLFLLQAQLRRLTQQRPQLRVFWKNPDSVYLGATESFARDMGVGLELLPGLLDTDPRVAWSRQGPKFQRDDQKVLASGEPLLNFLERQDATDGTTNWLLTSKVPLHDGGPVVGLLGSYEIISAAEARDLQRRGFGL